MPNDLRLSVIHWRVTFWSADTGIVSRDKTATITALTAGIGKHTLKSDFVTLIGIKEACSKSGSHRCIWQHVSPSFVEQWVRVGKGLVYIDGVPWVTFNYN